MTKIGPEYTQAAVKTVKAAERLRFIRSERVGRMNEEQRRSEQEAYQKALALELDRILE